MTNSAAAPVLPATDAAAPSHPLLKPGGNLREETVTYVHHWTDTLFTFRTTRDASFRFINGQFAMIGLIVDNKPLLRAYSMVSANYEEFLEFLSIKVPNGPLTSRLQHIKVGDKIIVGKKATGTLLQDNLLPGKTLYLLGTGTGLAPFMSIIKDPEAYERYERVVLVHGVRTVAELAYEQFITKELPENEFFGEEVKQKLLYYPTVTREPYKNQGRVTDLIRNGKLFSDLGLPKLDINNDRLMLCGSPAMLAEMRGMLDEMGWQEGSTTGAGHYVIEKAFVEQ
ncbi:ferredoxin--NADP reductase [uncultured Ferrovibrio sp.]|jgi:ferredoxin--NADP+ reductase|uniref:ferredoxin--NADP reductase n=1 Tax=uncultured Ferrovibrio sp. TaxID=1576913 RepID=UPI00262F5F02|nr:ferredoxin--NADP reductase [uncultured Ferrovibrio sp.]